MSTEPRIAILVAEDSEDNRFLLQAYCRDTAFELTFAEDGEQAVEAYRAASYSVVVMDIQMPNLDGLSATRMIRSLEVDGGRKRTPILALTANVMPSDVVLAQEAGCDIHLAKPISKLRFLSALEQWKDKAVQFAGTLTVEVQPGFEQAALIYLTARHRELPKARSLLAVADFDALSGMAQSFIDTGKQNGFPEVSRLGAGIEKACMNLDAVHASRCLEALAVHLEAAQQQVRNLS